MSKHTPGEWTYDQEIRDIERGGEHIQQSLNLEVYGGEDGETRICEIFGLDIDAGNSDEWAYTPEAKANAELIANAPDTLAERDALLVEKAEMLESLRWAVPLAEMAMEDYRLLRLKNGHDDIGAGTDKIGLWPKEQAQIKQAKAAISKATGEKQ